MSSEMVAVGWDKIPKHLIDEAEELLRIVLRDPDMCFMTLQGVCYGLFNKSLADTTEVALDWNDLSAMGLIVYINANVFHPNHYAVMRSPDTGHSLGALLENEPWTYPPEVYQESFNQMLALNMLVEGWNIPWSDH